MPSFGRGTRPQSTPRRQLSGHRDAASTVPEPCEKQTKTPLARIDPTRARSFGAGRPSSTSGRIKDESASAPARPFLKDLDISRAIPSHHEASHRLRLLGTAVLPTASALARPIARETPASRTPTTGELYSMGDSTQHRTGQTLAFKHLVRNETLTKSLPGPETTLPKLRDSIARATDEDGGGYVRSRPCLPPMPLAHGLATMDEAV